MLRSPFDVVGEHLVGSLLRERLLVHHRWRLTILQRDDGVGSLADRLLVRLGNSEKITDRLHGHQRAQILDEVESARANQRIECPCAVLSRQRLDRFHAPRGEHTRQQSPVQIMQRRVLPQDDPWRHLYAREDNVGGSSSARAKRVPIRQRRGDIVVSAQRVEVVLLVVIERRFVPKSFPDRVRIVIDFEVIRVVVQVDRVRTCRYWSPFTMPRPGLASEPKICSAKATSTS